MLMNTMSSQSGHVYFIIILVIKSLVSLDMTFLLIFFNGFLVNILLNSNLKSLGFSKERSITLWFIFFLMEKLFIKTVFRKIITLAPSISICNRNSLSSSVFFLRNLIIDLNTLSQLPSTVLNSLMTTSWLCSLISSSIFLLCYYLK